MGKRKWKYRNQWYPQRYSCWHLRQCSFQIRRHLWEVRRASVYMYDNESL